jgi:hypothetical protein
MPNDTVNRRNALKIIGAASVGCVGTGSLSEVATGRVPNLGAEYQWCNSQKWQENHLNGGITDIGMHVGVEHVGNDRVGNDLYRYFDITTVHAANFRYGRGDSERPALLEYGFSFESGTNGSTSGIDRYDPDVVQGGRPITKRQATHNYPLNEYEIDNEAAVKNLNAVQNNSARGFTTMISVLAAIAEATSWPVVAAAGSYAALAMLGLGIIKYLSGPNGLSGESYTWRHGWRSSGTMHAVGVTHYDALPVQMDSGENGTFTVRGHCKATHQGMPGPTSKSLTVQPYIDVSGGL